MPIYDYLCEDCGKVFEEIHGKDEKNPPCPQCESEAVKKKMVTPFVSGGSCDSPKKSPFS